MPKISFDRDGSTEYDNFEEFKRVFEREWDSYTSKTEFIVYKRLVTGDDSTPKRTERVIRSGKSILNEVTEVSPESSISKVNAYFSGMDVTIEVYSNGKVTSTKIYEKELIEQLPENNN